MNTTLTSEMLLREIYLAETELRWFEQKYGLLSELQAIAVPASLADLHIDKKWSAPAHPVTGVEQGADRFCICPA